MKDKRTPIKLDDFSGGLFTKTPLIGSDSKFTPDCQDVYAEGKTLRKKPGFVKLNTVSIGTVDGNGFYHYVKSSTLQSLIASFGRTLYQMSLSGNTWDGTWQSISPSANGTAFSGAIMHFVNFSGTLIMATEARDHIQRLLSTDTTYSNVESGGVGIAPLGKYLQVWKDQLWVLNIASAGTLTEDCGSIGSWTDNDTGTGASTQTTFGGQSTFRFRAGTVANDDAKRTRDIGTLPDSFLVETRNYFATLGTVSSGDYAEMNFSTGTILLKIRWSDDGLEVFDGTNWKEVGVNLATEGSFAVWKFLVTAGTGSAATIDFLKDGSFVGLQFSCANVNTANDGQIDIFARAGGSVSRADWYMDYLYIVSMTNRTNFFTNNLLSSWTDQNTPANFTEALIPTQPVFHYRLNDSNNTSVFDSGSQGVNGVASIGTGTAINTTLLTTTNAKIGRAFSFTSASNHNVNFTASAVSANSIGTISFWFNPQVMTGNIVSFGNSTADKFLAIDWVTPGTVRFVVQPTSSLDVVVSPSFSFSTGSWYHMVWVQDGSEIKCYVNTTLQTLVYTTSTDKLAWLDNVSSIDKGALAGLVSNSGFSNPSSLLMDDFRYYSSALSLDRIKAIYAEGNGTESGARFIDVKSVTEYQFRTSPYAQYKMNDNAASTVVTDAGYGGNNGASSANTSALTTTGKISSAFKFVAASSHNINVDALAVATTADNCGSLCCWLNMPSIGTARDIVSFTKASNETRLEVQVDSGGDIVLAVYNAGSALLNVTAATANLASATWYHMAIVQNGFSPLVYLNGVSLPLTFSTASNTGAWVNSMGTVDTGRIGCLNFNGGGNTTFFNGTLDDFRYYRRVLSQSEVWTIYNDGSGTEDASPTYGSWRSFRSERTKTMNVCQITSSSPDSNVSTVEILTVGKTTDVYKCLIRFNDFSNIPSGATIKSANLKLYCSEKGSAVNGDKIDFYELLKDWTNSGVTWNKYDGVTAWGTAGAGSSGDDFTATSIGQTDLAVATATLATQYFTVGLNSTGIAALQAWVNGTRQNNGFLMVQANTANNTYLNFNSGVHGINWTATADYVPYLDVAFTHPDQPGEVEAKIGSDLYRIENRGDYALAYQTVTSSTAIAGNACVFGAWIKAGSGVLHKLIVDDGTSEYSSSVFTGNGCWQYRSLSFTPITGATAVKAKIILTTEGIIKLSNPSIVLSSIPAVDDNSDRIQRSASTTFNDWTGINSGYNDLPTTQDKGLTGSFILNDRMYVTKKFSIHRFTYTNSTPLVDIKQIRNSVGTASPRSIKNVDVPGSGEVVIFFGTNRRLYAFDGFDATPLSDQISITNGLTSFYMENINSQALDKVWAMVHTDLNWYELFVPLGSATTPTHSFIYDYVAKSFWGFANRNFSSGGVADSGVGQRQPFALGNSDGYSYVMNSGTSDDGVAINSYWNSFKLADSELLLVMDELEVLTDSVNCTPSFSWRMDYETAYTTKVLSANTYAHNYNPRRVDNLIQFKFQDNSLSTSFKLWAIKGLAKPVGYGK